LRSCQLCSYSRTSQHFMEPEGSLPCSQEPSTSPYSEPDQSNPYHPISLRSILRLSTHLRLGLTSGLFPSYIPTTILYAIPFAPIRATFPAHLILLDLIILIILGENYSYLAQNVPKYASNKTHLSTGGHLHYNPPNSQHTTVSARSLYISLYSTPSTEANVPIRYWVFLNTPSIMP
jgi:hypothetical protein